MSSRAVKDFVKTLSLRAGYEIVPRHFRPGAQQRQVGNLTSFLEDCRARGFVPKTVFDIGANRGEWSASVQKVFPSATFSLFEPLFEFRRALESFCSAHPPSAYFPCALGATSGTAEMFVHAESSLDGSTLWGQAEKRAGSLTSDFRKVSVETLDGLAGQGKIVEAPDLAKLDVQGFELEVLKGATKALRGTSMFILEVSLFEFWKGQPILAEVVAFMDQHGYVLYDVPGVYRRRLDGALGQVDFAFVPRSSSLRVSNMWDPPSG